MINVPSLLDIDCTTADPTNESLTLSMIDYPTLEKISKFTKKDKIKLSEELWAYDAEAAGGSKSENEDTTLKKL